MNDEEAITRLCGSVVPDRSGFRFAEDRVKDGDRSFLDVLRESDGPTNIGTAHGATAEAIVAAAQAIIDEKSGD